MKRTQKAGITLAALVIACVGIAGGIYLHKQNSDLAEAKNENTLSKDDLEQTSTSNKLVLPENNAAHKDSASSSEGENNPLDRLKGKNEMIDELTQDYLGVWHHQDLNDEGENHNDISVTIDKINGDQVTFSIGQVCLASSRLDNAR